MTLRAILGLLLEILLRQNVQSKLLYILIKLGSLLLEDLMDSNCRKLNFTISKQIKVKLLEIFVKKDLCTVVCQ